MADPAGGRTLPLTFPKHFPDKGDIIKDIWSSKWQKSGVKIRRVQGWTVHRCPTLCPPFWPPLVLKLNCIFSRFCLFSWKMLLLSKKVPFCTENMQLDIRKVLFFCKKVPLCLEKVPFCSKKCPFFDLSTVALISYYHPCFIRPWPFIKRNSKNGLVTGVIQ